MANVEFVLAPNILKQILEDDEVDPKIYLDTEPNTGTVIRGSKPVQRNLRIKPSILFPDVEDLLVPCFVRIACSGWE